MGRGRGREGEGTHTRRGVLLPLCTHSRVLLTNTVSLDSYSAFALYAPALARSGPRRFSIYLLSIYLSPSRCDDFWLEVWNYLG